MRVAQILDNPFGSSSQEVETELRKSYAQMYDILPHLEWVGLTISVELTGVSTLQHHQQVDLVVLDKNDCQEVIGGAIVLTVHVIHMIQCFI